VGKSIESLLGNLSKTKKWYSLSDAAKRLSETLQEAISREDVIQMIVDRSLRVSVHLQNKKAELLAPYTRLRGFWPLSPPDIYYEFAKQRGDPLADERVAYQEHINLEASHEECPVTTEGIYWIDLDESPHIADNLLQELTRETADYAGMEGLFVRDSENSLWRLVDGMELSMKERIKARKQYQKKVITEDEYHATIKTTYFPADWSPENDQLIIQDADLIALEESLLYDRAKDKNELGARERATLIKIIYGMAVTKYGYSSSNSRNPATGKNKGSIAFDLEKLGLEVSAETIRKYLNELD
jgi:hypothetical protein